MSLPDVRAKFREEFTKPIFRVKKERLTTVIDSNPQRVGTAFDYLLRFYLSYINSNVKTSHWVAETSLQILDDCRNIDEIIITPNNRLAKARNIEKLPKKYIKICKELKNKTYLKYNKELEIAKNNYESYLKTGNMNEAVICSSLALAKMDVIKRAGYLPPLDSTPSEEKDKEDLKQLVSLINPDLFKAVHTCVLNPRFGVEIAQLIHADGDLVVDNTLIEIKTVKAFKVERKNFDQLLGYYTMYRIAGITGMPPDNNITKLGVYFSRHGYLHIYHIDDLINESTYLDFIEWFKIKAQETAVL